MKLYYYKADGGAEYYCLKAIPGTDEGDVRTALLRTDGNEIEINYFNMMENGIKLIAKANQRVHIL